MQAARRKRSGQALSEFVVLYAGVVLPLTFMIVFVAEMLWVWHGVNDFTRDGARYASTHCWTSDGSNVLAYMESHVPAILDRSVFENGDAGISIQYFTDGGVTPFSSDSCSGICVPATVSVSITNYQFLRFASFMKQPPVKIPPFTTVLPMESAGYQDASGVCVP
ncbi:MAG TPA: hypothetical protein VKU19_05295 [Bryobacteraceae bacterium]|nr:hypothetical protein [Bryobacteraceae bacterium]